MRFVGFNQSITMSLQSIFSAMLLSVFALPSPWVQADLGALENYRGDWMVDANRQHLVSTNWQDDGSPLKMRYAYVKHYCPHWVRKTWTMNYDAETNTYTASITGGGTETAIGKWNAETKTFIWSVLSKRQTPGSAGEPKVFRLIEHRFSERTIRWKLKDPKGKEYKGQINTFDVLVPYDEIAKFRVAERR